MFVPKIYKNENIDDIKAFITDNSFGIIVSQLDQKLCATHIPIGLVEQGDGTFTLQGHVSKANLQWRNFADKSDVLVIFNGPHTYISSSWYGHENVPTWNYIAVHVYGKLRLLEGEALWNHLAQLVDKYEKASIRPVSMNTMSKDFVRKEMKGLVGFEIEISDIQAAYKLSQNRNDADHANIIEALENTNDSQSVAIANEMKKTRHHTNKI
jgi:transcriptional regulator